MGWIPTARRQCPAASLERLLFELWDTLQPLSLRDQRSGKQKNDACVFAKPASFQNLVALFILNRVMSSIKGRGVFAPFDKVENG